MKILIVSQYFKPENVSIPVDIAEALVSRGHSVRVLTGYPNYPAGKIFPGYSQQWRQLSRDDGIDVCRVPLFVNHSQHALKRMMNYLSFAFTSASARNFARDADVIYVYATQMTPALGPWLWRMIGGAPYLLHVVDLWPDSVVGSSITGGHHKAQVIEKILSLWIGRVYKRASMVVGISPTMVRTLVSRGVDPHRAELVYNWADSFPISRTAPEPSPPINGGIDVVYAGNVGEMQDLEVAIRAAARASDCGVRLTIVGDGIAKAGLVQLARELGVSNVRFQDPVPRSHMPQIYAQADFGLVSLKDLQVFRGTIPSKFPSVLAHGIPAITTVQGDVRAMNEMHGLGIAADAESVDDLERAFREAADLDIEERKLMGDRVRKFAESLFTKNSAISNIESLLIRIAEERHIEK